MPRETTRTEWRRCDGLRCGNRAMLYDHPAINQWPREWVTVTLNRGNGPSTPVAYFCSDEHAKEWMAALLPRPATDWDFDTMRFVAVMDGLP